MIFHKSQKQSTIFKTITNDVAGLNTGISIFNSSLSNIKKNIASGQGIAYSIFNGDKLTQNDVTAITNYANAVKNGVKPTIAMRDNLKGLSAAGFAYVKQSRKMGQSTDEMVDGLRKVPKATTAASVGLKALSIAGNMLLSMGISLAISVVVNGIQKLANAQEDAIAKADEFISKFEEQRDSLTSNKQTIDSISSDYQKLAQGVDSLGRNISLNSTEYARYNEIVNQIAEMFPQMVRGYTDEGNAIIAHKGNVAELTKAYQDQKKAAQDAIIVGSADVFKGFKAKADNVADFFGEEYGLIQKKEQLEMAKEILSYGRYDNNNKEFTELISLFTNRGLSRTVLKEAGINDWSASFTGVFDILDKNRTKILAYFDTISSEIEAETEKIKPIMQAYLERSDKFQLADGKVQDMVKQIVGQFDAEFYRQFDTETEMASWVETNVIDKLRGNEDLTNNFGIILDLQTKFNEGDITVAEYQEKLTAFLSLIDTLPKETQKAIKLLFGIKVGEDGSETSDFDTMVNNVTKKVGDKFKDKVGKLKLPDLEILSDLDISPKEIENWSEIETLIANARKEIKETVASIDDLVDTSDKIKSLGSAFKELADNGYITTKTLSEIQTATDLSGDEWAEYETKLMSAKKGSAEFNQTIADLTHKVLDQTFASKDLNNLTEQQIAATLRENGVVNASAVAHDWLTKAKAKEKAASTKLIDASELNIAALLEEGTSCGVTEKAYLELVAQEIIFNRNDLDVEDKVKKLLQIAQAAGIATSNLDALNRKFNSQADFHKYVTDSGGKIIPVSTLASSFINSQNNGFYGIGTFKFGNNQTSGNSMVYEYELPDGTRVKTQQDYMSYMQMYSLADSISNASNSLVIPNFSSLIDNTKSGSSSDPDYQDATDAIINRINLRAVELKQEEESIKKALELAKIEKDYGKQIEESTNLLNKRKERLNELTKPDGIQFLLHNEAEYLRNSTPQWDEDTWFDSQGNPTKAYYDLYNSTKDPEEQKKIQIQFNALSKYKQSYLANENEIAELNKQIFQDQKETLPQLWEGYTDDEISDIEHKIDLRNTLGEQDFEADIADYEQIQRIAHARSGAWTDLGYDKNSEEVQKWDKIEADAISDIRDTYEAQMDNVVSDIESGIDNRRTLGIRDFDADIADYEEIQRVSRARAQAYLDAGYSEESEEVQKWRKAEINAISDARNSYESKYDDVISDIEYTANIRNSLGERDINADIADYEEIQNIARARAQAWRDAGYGEESEEVQKWVQIETDNAAKAREAYEAQIDNAVSSIEYEAEIRNTLGERDFNANVADYKEIQRIAHERAEAWRAAGYSESSEEIKKWQKVWMDAETSIWEENRKQFDERLKLSEDYIQHSIDFGWENGDNEIDARKRVLDWIQSDYYKSLIKDDEEYYKILEENRLKYINAIKNEFTKSNNFANSYFSSRKSILQAQFDIENSIAEARHEISKDLETSMTMYEYLDEETRKLLFNQEDYNTLCEELNEIEYESLRLKSEYEDKIANATLETVESITSEYQMQYETLMKSYEISKAELDIAKKKQKLNNVLNERNVRMFVNGSWQWVANTQDVADAKSELADAEYAKRISEAGLTQQNSINEITKRQDALGVVIKGVENGVVNLGEAISLAKDAIGEMPAALNEAYSKIKAAEKSSNSESISYSGGGSSKYSSLTLASVTIPGSSNKASVFIDGSGSVTDPNLPMGTVVHTDGGDYQIVPKGTEGAKYNKGSGYYSIKLDEKDADGTRYTLGGLTLMGEEGSETYITANGRLIPIEQPTIGNIPSGPIQSPWRQWSDTARGFLPGSGS